MLGGGQRSLLLFLKRLDRTRFKPFLACPSTGGLTEKARKLGIETHIIRMDRLKSLNLVSIWAAVLKLKNLIKKKRIDLIHTDSPRQALYAGMAAKQAHLPLVWHVRVSTPEKKSLEKLLYKRSNKVIAVSRAASQRFRDFALAADKVTVIHNGVDLTEFSPQQPDKRLMQELDIPESWILVGTLGQLIPGKGQHVLLEAAVKVLDQIPRVKFMIVGDGDQAYRKKLVNLTKELGLSGKVVFAGFWEDIPRIMNILDIVVLPSTTHLEGFSRVIIEAMACSKPVIASHSGGNPEAIDDGTTGFLVPPDNPDRLAGSILRLVKDETKRKQMGEAGRKKAEKLFSIEQNVSRIEKVYEELLCPDQ